MSIPPPVNEPVKSYAPGTPERAEIRAAIANLRAGDPELGPVIGGRDVTTGVVREVREPHAHARVLARYHAAGAEEARQAIDAARGARAEWASWTLEQRAAVFLRAADLLSGPWRADLNAATMLGQSKTVQQAEIDSACEVIDFFRFNARFAAELEAQQPISSAGVWNRLELRPLDGFVFAISPFNFTAIGANLPTAPALMGNTVVWKPASTAVVSAHRTMRLLQAAGLPDGVINLVPGDAAAVSGACLEHRDLAGLHFTGSTDVFQQLWSQIGSRIASYGTYPRIVGETGGKNFVVAHHSAEPAALATALVRGAFEYQGQKCSAASRAYIPASLWQDVLDGVSAQVARIRVGDVADLGNFMGAVIDERAFRRLREAIALARASDDAEILLGGGCDDSEGWFIEPTLVRTTDPSFDLMQRELFGPLLCVYVYPDDRYDEILQVANDTSPYALTGSVFARSRAAVEQAHRALRFAAGNFYVNDKPTGAVVGQQPFGGARASGTNDKAGSPLNLARWISARAVKETFDPPTDFAYPYLDAE
ncbi:MAG: 1-pyrroline-5-carboxylate dehydrogenase [Gaiellales bacterium]|jgi:1-pyrroline-5-carboxylate dehydrogenase|nr:1-pyrroline-5-carboxylate dehydrogenase [Gaiellales bacterium]